jgi:hypothetical protein
VQYYRAVLDSLPPHDRFRAITGIRSAADIGALLAPKLVIKINS